MSDATAVLVHGAWSGSWIWGKVLEGLRERGIEAIAVDLPSCSATDASMDVHGDAKHVADVIDGIDGPVVLVGNSYGGVVITEAGVGRDNVRHLVYIAAAMPEPSEPIFDVLQSASAPEFGAGIGFLEDGRLTLDSDVCIKTAFNQASAADHDLWRKNGSPAMSYGTDFAVSLPVVAWQSIPSTYVVCSDDRAIRPEAQREWAKERATNVVEWPTDHCPHLSSPDRVVELIASL